jgi:hypothetical protein
VYDLQSYQPLYTISSPPDAQSFDAASSNVTCTAGSCSKTKWFTYTLDATNTTRTQGSQASSANGNPPLIHIAGSRIQDVKVPMYLLPAGCDLICTTLACVLTCCMQEAINQGL